jgi:hypothetical protein
VHFNASRRSTGVILVRDGNLFLVSQPCSAVA